MKLTKTLLVAALSLPLTGTGASMITAPADDSGAGFRLCGSDVTVGKKLPDNTPSFVEVCPGAEITLSGVSESDGKVTGTITLKSTDSFEKVVAFYKASVEKSGIKPVSSFASENVQIFTADDGEQAYSVSVGVNDEGLDILIVFKK